jgi:hypothetical protein
MKELNSVKKFSDANADNENMMALKTSVIDYFNQCQSERGIVGKTFSTEYSKSDKEEVINKLFVAEVERRSGMAISSMNNVVEYAQAPQVRTCADSIINFLIDMILPETLIGSIGLVADIKFGGYGDSFKFDIENNALFTVSAAGRRVKTAPAQVLEKTTATLTPYNHQVTVIVNLPEVFAGRKSLAAFMMKAVRSIETQMLYETYDAFTTAMESANIPAAFVNANYTELGLIAIAEKVTAFNQGRKAVIFGTPTALKSILPTSLNTRILLDDAYVKMGHLTSFNGYDVVPMTQVADYTSSTYALKLRNDRIYILSPANDKVVKVAVGETLSYTDGVFEMANRTQSGTINKAWAVGVITNSYVGVIKL